MGKVFCSPENVQWMARMDQIVSAVRDDITNLIDCDTKAEIILQTLQLIYETTWEQHQEAMKAEDKSTALFCHLTVLGIMDLVRQLQSWELDQDEKEVA